MTRQILWALALGWMLLQVRCAPLLCDVDFECKAPTPHCLTGLCVACIRDSHCPRGQRCLKNGCSGAELPLEETSPPEPPAVDGSDGVPDSSEAVGEQSTPDRSLEAIGDGTTPRDRLPQDRLPQDRLPPTEASPQDSGACSQGQSRACYTGPPNTQGKGRCLAGKQSCDKGKWGSCAGELLPVAETCDGADNDCDGSVDEGNPDGGGSCNSSKKGECQAGTRQCKSGAITCVPKNQPAAEVCNGKDDDCNGKVDDINSKDCYGIKSGACQKGKTTCRGGKMTCDNLSNVSCSSTSDCGKCPGGTGDYSCIIRFRRCVLR